MICRVQDAISEIQYAIRESAVAIAEGQDKISKIMDAIRGVQDIPPSSTSAISRDPLPKDHCDTVPRELSRLRR